jgi:tRNA G46 methylase TrmB
MIAFLCAITVLLIAHSECGASGFSSQIDHRIINFLHHSNFNSYHMHMHTVMRARQPITMAFQRLATKIYAGKRFQHHNTTDVTQPRLRRRRNFIGVMSMHNSDDTTTKLTQYTINDSVCPPTDPDILEKVVQKHIHALPRYWFSRPVANHTAEAFQEALGKFLLYTLGVMILIPRQEILKICVLFSGINVDFVTQFRKMKHFADDSKVNVILDSGCGTGKSSIILGEMYPNCIVIGVDQSIARLSRNKSYKQSDDSEETDSINQINVHTHDQGNNSSIQNKNQNDNVLLLRAELSDFWTCCLSSLQWQASASIYKHYVLYPNPYPKKSRLKSRFYAHPAFPLLMMTIMMDDDASSDGLPTEEDKLVVRSNWKGYLNEFKSAIETWNNCGGTFSEWKKYLASNGIDNSGDDWYPGNESPFLFETSGPNRMDLIIKDDPKRFPMSNFESKYLECGEPIYELTTRVVRNRGS